MVKKLLHTRYRVQNLEKNSFVLQRCPWIERNASSYIKERVSISFLKAPQSEEEIEICQFDESGPVVVGHDLTHLAFEVDDIEAFGKESAKKGYPLSDGPHKGETSILGFIDAPEGYEIELIQRLN